MEKNIKGINTADGTALIDYEALANKPNSDKNLTVDGGFADGKKTGDELKKKVNVNQGTGNNGKIMTVDNNGNIAPSETIQATKVVDSSGKNIQTKIQEIEDAPKLPLGGKTGNILSKKSMTDGDAEWVDAPPTFNAIYDENEERIVFSRSTKHV